MQNFTAAGTLTNPPRHVCYVFPISKLYTREKEQLEFSNYTSCTIRN